MTTGFKQVQTNPNNYGKWTEKVKIYPSENQSAWLINVRACFNVVRIFLFSWTCIYYYTVLIKENKWSPHNSSIYNWSIAWSHEGQW